MAEGSTGKFLPYSGAPGLPKRSVDFSVSEGAPRRPTTFGFDRAYKINEKVSATRPARDACRALKMR